MGKKGSWFSAIKRAFSHKSKDKPTHRVLLGSDYKKNIEEKKKNGKVISKHKETKSFIPLFREPSSIEKILGEADQLLIRPPKTPPSLTELPASPKSVSHVPLSPTVASSPKPHSPKSASVRISSPKPYSSKFIPSGASSLKTASVEVTQAPKEISYVNRLQPSIKHQHLSATKIQAAYRGYKARRSFKAFKGILKLQGVARGQNVKRQTMNALKQMQLLVRVQTQIQSRRIQMFENQEMHPKPYRNDNDWTQPSEFGKNENWNGSSLTIEEVDARLHKKVEAAIKRERAMAYAYSLQLWKSPIRSSQTPTDLQSNGYPWWWNWLEPKFVPTTTTQNQFTTKNFTLTPPRHTSEYKLSQQLHSNHYNHTKLPIDKPSEAYTPRSSSRSSVPVKTKQPNRQMSSDVSLKDNDSLMSCPPFSVPNYMTPTVSAKAKVRANSNPKERFIGSPSPSNDSRRRFSFPLTPNADSFRWTTIKGSNKDSSPEMGLSKHKYACSTGNRSVESVVSMPVIVGRKPFNRFV